MIKEIGDYNITINNIEGSYLLITRSPTMPVTYSVFQLDDLLIGILKENIIKNINEFDGYINQAGSFVEVLGGGYKTKIYNIKDFQNIKINGVLPFGTCYCFYENDNMTGIVQVSDFGRINMISDEINKPHNANYIGISEYISSGEIKIFGLDYRSKTIICFGDSITQGNYAHETESYPYYLQNMDKTHEYVNSGTGGWGTLQIAARIGGIPIYTPFDVEIPNNTTDYTNIATASLAMKSVEANQNVFIIDAKYDSGDGRGVYDYGKINPCRLGGIEVNISNDGTLNGFNTPSSDFVLKVKRTQTDPSIGDKSIIIPSGTILETFASHFYRKSFGMIFFIGTNDPINEFSMLSDRIKRLVDFYGKKNYIVIGPWIASQMGSQNTIPELNSDYQQNVKSANIDLRNRF